MIGTRRLLAIPLAVALSATTLEAQTPQAQAPFLQAFLFGDVLFTLQDADVPDGFRLGQMVAHGNATLSERVVFFGELSVTARTSGYSLAMERAIIRYDFSDPVKVSAGRYHTPISYWNTEYHHGLWLQGSVARPEAIKFGSRYIPVHFVGAMLEGNLQDIPVHYSVGFGNGRGANIAAAGDAGDVNGKRAFIASASVRPRSLFGFRVGGGVYFDRISVGGVEFADELITSAHLVWKRGSVDLVAEYINVSHEPVAGGASESSPAWYLHLGYRLSGDARDLMPYVRYESMDIAAGDLVFTGQVSDYDAFVLGARYDFSELAALKAEYRSEEVGGGDRLDAYYIQASFAIPVAGGS
ncbi:MAG: hypothetical protein R3253_10945 [Longimicrobiales bacterium]|nr:hypothetical protein [Longimicrobiales bacterium]